MRATNRQITDSLDKRKDIYRREDTAVQVNGSSRRCRSVQSTCNASLRDIAGAHVGLGPLIGACRSLLGDPWEGLVFFLRFRGEDVVDVPACRA